MESKLDQAWVSQMAEFTAPVFVLKDKCACQL